jgi:hypothetical protein
MPTLYASFVDPAAAEHAAGALFDHGIASEQLTILVGEGSNFARSYALERDANKGISTTTAGDAGAGAIKGLVVGSGIGLAAALAVMFIPGIGLVLGGGALGLALAGEAGAIAAGGLAGGVIGYLKDQGVGADTAATYENVLQTGGAVLAVSSATDGKLSLEEIESLLTKYDAIALSTTYGDGTATPQIPINTEPVVGTVREPSGVAYEAPMVMVEGERQIPVATQPDVDLDRVTGEELAARRSSAEVL